jgi:hypothetical protein
MINREKLLEEEHLDLTIEKLLDKINQAIIAYNLRNQDADEANKLKTVIAPKLQQFINMYQNEFGLFEKDKESSKDERKNIETKLLEYLGEIIKDLEEYLVDINKMTEKTIHGQNVTHEYEELLRIHSDYAKKSEKVTSYVHALE